MINAKSTAYKIGLLAARRTIARLMEWRQARRDKALHALSTENDYLAYELNYRLRKKHFLTTKPQPKKADQGAAGSDTP